MSGKKNSAAEIETLVRRAQRGNEESFAQLFDIFFEKIFRYVQFRVNRDETEDIVSDIFLKVVENLKKYTTRKKIGISAWIFRIAHNTVIDFYRKKQDLLGLTDADTGETIIDIPNDDLTPNQRVQHNWECKVVHEILQKLPSVHREILKLKFLEDFSNAEVAAITGKSEGNIRVIQLRALREMRKHFPSPPDA